MDEILVFDATRRILETGPVCDSCLGRRLAERSHGLTNAERGNALRVAVALAENVPFEPEAECWVCNGLSWTFEHWAERAVNDLTGVEFETYLVGTREPPFLTSNEHTLCEQADIPLEWGESFKSECNREVGKRLGQLSGAITDFDHPDVTVILDFEYDSVDVQINPAFIYGRYRKLESGVSQTQLTCPACGGRSRVWREGGQQSCERCGGSGRLAERSVEEFVSPPIQRAMDGSSTVFHGAGREHADTLVLGTGRPFVVEVKEPRRRAVDFDILESEINEVGRGVVEVDGLAQTTREMVERVKQLPFRQTYRMTVEFAHPVSNRRFADAMAKLEGMRVHQTSRQDGQLLGRERIRTVHESSGELESDGSATIELTVEAGTDVESILTGDEGMTKPSLAELLEVDVTVTSHAIVAVEGVEEPFEVPSLLS